MGRRALFVLTGLNALNYADRYVGAAVLPLPAYEGSPQMHGDITMSVREIRNFDYMILLCGKMKETRAFYKDVMGFPIELDRENWVSSMPNTET